MSQFLALPNEIKLHIIDYIHPATIVSFAVACKAIVNLSHAALGKHKASWNNCHLHLGTYNGFQDEPEDNDFWQRRLGAQIHPLTFLDETMKDSGVRAYYITKLHLEKTYSFDGDSPDELAQKTFNEELHRVLDARGPDISRLIDESPFIAADRREEWRTALIDPDINRSADAYIGLLLPLLPNLQSVSVTDVSGQVCVLEALSFLSPPSFASFSTSRWDHVGTCFMSYYADSASILDPVGHGNGQFDWDRQPGSQLYRLRQSPHEAERNCRGQDGHRIR